MSEVSIITNDEIMEMTQLVFDRYYSELKRQLRRGEIPAEKAEEYCTEILSKVYQALQTRGVAATSYEMDACAIPIINEEIRKILVPLHLNGYRNLRENPLTESQSETEATLDDERVVEGTTPEESKETMIDSQEPAVDNSDTVPVVSNGEVKVYQENTEEELNPELRMEIRRILQQEFQLEPAQVKPVVVVVNVAAPQTAPQTAAQEEEETKETNATEAQASEETVETEYVQAAPAEAAATTEEPLPELDFDIEKLVQEGSEVTEEADANKKSKHLWLWIPIIMLLLILLWLTIGMLMSYEILPEFDLGYEWFNETLFELF